jgi:serine beta-lactamase-like protein LACTB, mitochondrial
MKMLAAVAAVAVLAGSLGVVLWARGAAQSAAESGRCRDWVTTGAYAREIAAARPLVSRMKRAFAAPGVSVAIAAEGKLVWSASCGFADLARRVPVTRRTTFRIGSVSKPLTAVTVARLAQAGRMDLDADVRRYAPAFPRKRYPITMRQLGGHLGGIRHYEGREALSRRHYASVTASLQIFKDDPLVAVPGTRFVYSSYGFNLLGAAVEGAADRPFAAAVTETTLSPLGMTRTRLDRGGPPRGRTRFYEVMSRRRAVAAPRVDLSNRFPSGGFLSTAEDLARLGIGITDPAFLEPQTRELLFSSQRTTGGEATRYGFGFEVGQSPFGPVVGHTGNVVGGTAFLFLHPRTRVAVALTTNIGFVTAAIPPSLGRGVPDPPQLAVPFIRRVLAG